MRERELEARRTKEICERDLELIASTKEQLPAIVDSFVESFEAESVDNEGASPFPSPKRVVEIIEDLRDLLHPEYWEEQEIHDGRLSNYVSGKVIEVFGKLSWQISLSVRHGCMKSGEPCTTCVELGQAQAMRFLERTPELRKLMKGDIKAAFDRDPAARSLEEIILSYPGVQAITVYRLAHELWLQEVPLIPRMMTEYAHTITGIDIHPGATIGSNLFIDHGTGVVIGETTEIGDNVTIYQGVTLGGYRFRRAADGSLERGYKRHPTVGDDVIIYAGATILGGDTVIGARSVIGGSVWLTHSVPSDAVVMIQEPDLKYKIGYREERTHGANL